MGSGGNLAVRRRALRGWGGFREDLGLGTPARGGEDLFLLWQAIGTGATVVYRRGTGGEVVSPLWSDEPGIYAVPAEGGEPRLVTRDGVQPHFAADSERVYLLRNGDEDTRSLVSLDLDGSDEPAKTPGSEG